MRAFAETDDAQDLALDLDADELAALPLAGLDAGAGLGHLAGHAHDQADGVLGGGLDVARGRVHDHDAQLGGGGHVHVVDADAGARHHLEVGGGLQQLGGDLGLGADEQGVVGGDDLEQVGGAGLGEFVDLQGLAENGQAVGGELLRDEDLGLGRVPVGVSECGHGGGVGEGQWRRVTTAATVRSPSQCCQCERWAHDESKLDEMKCKKRSIEVLLTRY